MGFVNWLRNWSTWGSWLGFILRNYMVSMRSFCGKVSIINLMHLLVHIKRVISVFIIANEKNYNKQKLILYLSKIHPFLDVHTATDKWKSRSLSICFIDLLVLSLFTPEHNPLMSPFHQTWFWGCASSSLNLYPAFVISASLHQMFFCLSPFRFALRVMCECMSCHVLCWLPESIEYFIELGV